MGRRQGKATGADGKEEIEPLTRQATGTKAIVDKAGAAEQTDVSVPSRLAHTRGDETYKGVGVKEGKGGDVVGGRQKRWRDVFVSRPAQHGDSRTYPSRKKKKNIGIFRTWTGGSSESASSSLSAFRCAKKSYRRGRRRARDS